MANFRAAAAGASLTGAAAMMLGCFALAPSEGGGETAFAGERPVDPADVAVPPGYRVDVVATGLDFPTGVAFDDRGTPHITEAGYSYGEVWTRPRLVRIGPGGTREVVATGEPNGPWNGVDYAGGAFYVAEGGQRDGGRILRITPGGEIDVLVGGLPSVGDHHTNGPVVAADGYLYFGQGTATNSGVVGPDNHGFGWLDRHPEFHDIPAVDIVLTGENFESDNPLTPEKGDKAVTGAYLPFGTPSRPGQVIEGELPCTGAIMRVPLEGGPLELVAWGLRNPYGLALSPEGALYCTENSYDVRGSRPVFGTGDQLWRIEPGEWYGWPDLHGRRPLTDERFAEAGGKNPGFVLAEHPGTPPRPAAVLGVHSAACGMDFSTSDRFGHVGDCFIAEFGDMAPNVGKVESPVGYRVVRVEPLTGVVHGFASNYANDVGPASFVGGAGLERPVAARFGPDGESLYVVDFGVMTVTEKGPRPRLGTGVLWRITREAQP